MSGVIFTINGQETLCRYEQEFESNGNFKFYKTTAIITKDEFLTAYNTWVKK